jgi:hypothetical protein
MAKRNANPYGLTPAQILLVETSIRLRDVSSRGLAEALTIEAESVHTEWGRILECTGTHSRSAAQLELLFEGIVHADGFVAIQPVQVPTAK